VTKKKLTRAEQEFVDLQKRNDVLLALDEEKFAAEIEANKRKQDKILKDTGINSQKVMSIKQKENEIFSKLDQQRLAAVGAFFGGLASISAFGGKQNFEIAKRAAQAEAIIAGALAFSKALASAPPPFGAIFAAGVAIKTASQIRTIEGTTLQTGIDSVPGTGTADNFPALLAPGERVVPTKTNQDLTEFLAGSGTQTELLQIIADRLANIEPVAMVQIGNQDILTSVNDAIDEGGTLAS